MKVKIKSELIDTKCLFLLYSGIYIRKNFVLHDFIFKPYSIFIEFQFFLDWISAATWRWVANDDNCGICRMPFESCCTECLLPGDDCPLGKITIFFI